MFNKMIDTLDEPLSEDLIKTFHYELKSGVFEDRSNGYAIGDYKKHPNMWTRYLQIKMFDDPITVESPGTLHGIVFLRKYQMPDSLRWNTLITPLCLMQRYGMAS